MSQSSKYHITVQALAQYLPEQSSESDRRYVFSYTVTITNTGEETAQLVSRHWIITDADEQVQEVKGLGVVGEQPTLKPGETFQYSSGSAIATPVGIMTGTYQMMATDGTPFEAKIPPFVLSVPRILH
jgi:ApaG protein